MIGGLPMFLAWKDIKRNKRKFFVISLVLLSTIYLVFFTLGLSTGLRENGASKIIHSSAETFILREGSSSRLENSSFSGSYATKIQEEIGEEALVLGVRLTNVENISDEEVDQSFGISYIGIEPHTFMSPQITVGRAPEQADEVLASRPIENEGVSIGDRVRDTHMNIDYTIVGFTEEETFNYSPILYISPEQFIETSLHGQMSGYATVQAIATQLLPEEVAPIVEGFDVEINSKDEIVQATPGLYAQSVSFFLLILCMYIISGTILAMFFYILTLQKKGEYGLVKALGGSTRFLFYSILSQVLIVSTSTIFLSLILIYLTILILPSIVPFSLSLSSVIGSSFLFILVSLLGALASIKEVHKIDPILVMGGKG